MQEKIVHYYGRMPAIYFPRGKKKDGGTCEFATSKCLKWCEAEAGGELHKRVYDFITEKAVDHVVMTILYELKETFNDSKHLYWFPSGDCETKHTKKILAVMKELQAKEIIQTGYTRNRKLWENVRDELDYQYIRVALTVEKKDLSRLKKEELNGLFVVPDYDKGRVRLYLGGPYGERHETQYACGSDFFYDYDAKGVETRESNCPDCYEKEVGCWS